MRLTSKKIIVLLLLLGTTGDLIGFIPIFGLASKPEKDH